MFDNKAFYWVAYILVLVGGINWGFIGLFNANIIQGILGVAFSRLIFFIVGLGAVYLLIDFFRTGRVKEARKEVSEYANKEIDAYKKKRQHKKDNDDAPHGSNHSSHSSSGSDSVDQNDSSDNSRHNHSHPGHSADKSPSDVDKKDSSTNTEDDKKH